MTVADLMRTDVVTVTRDTPIVAVATQLRNENVGSGIVVDDDRPVGIITDRDIAVRIVADNLDPSEMTAGDTMTENPATVDRDVGVMDLCRELSDAGIRRMPVVDGDALVGIITLDDLTRLFVRELNELSDVVESESPPY